MARRRTSGRRSSSATSMATATVPLGDLTSEQMRVLGELARAYGDGTVRVTMDQNLVFRWVPVGDVRELYRRLAAAGLGLAEASTIADVASCPGAESCRLAVTQSRGLGPAARGSSARAARSHRGGRRRAHQDQRLPERLRPASHRDDRLPGQRAARRRQGRAAVLRDGRRRHDDRRAPASRGPPRRFRRAGFPRCVERLIALYQREKAGRASRRRRSSSASTSPRVDARAARSAAADRGRRACRSTSSTSPRRPSSRRR